MSKGLGGHLQISAPLDTKAFFFFFFFLKCLSQRLEKERIYMPPLSFPRNPELPILPRIAQMVNGTEVCT